MVQMHTNLSVGICLLYKRTLRAGGVARRGKEYVASGVKTYSLSTA